MIWSDCSHRNIIQTRAPSLPPYSTIVDDRLDERMTIAKDFNFHLLMAVISAEKIQHEPFDLMCGEYLKEDHP